MNLIYIDLRRERSRYQCRLTAYFLGVGVGWGVGVAEMSLVYIRIGLWWKNKAKWPIRPVTISAFHSRKHLGVFLIYMPTCTWMDTIVHHNKSAKDSLPSDETHLKQGMISVCKFVGYIIYENLV